MGRSDRFRWRAETHRCSDCCTAQGVPDDCCGQHRGQTPSQSGLRSGDFVDFATEVVEARVKELTGEDAHAVLAVSGSEASSTIAPKLARNLGVIVCVGLPINDFNLSISTTGCAARRMGSSTYDRWRSMRGLITFIDLTIKGTAVGTEKQMDELLQLAIRDKIKPLVHVLNFSETGSIFEKLRRDGITGRAVVKIPQ